MLPFYLREWRIHRGLKLEELAARVGVDKSVISRYELKRRRVHVATLYLLAEALDASPGHLFELPPGHPRPEESIDFLIRRWNPKQRKAVASMVRAHLALERSLRSSATGAARRRHSLRQE